MTTVLGFFNIIRSEPESFFALKFISCSNKAKKVIDSGEDA